MYTAVSQIKSYQGLWTEKQLRHLLRRSLFGYGIADLHFFSGKTMEECVDVLLTAPAPAEPPRNYYGDPDVPVGDITIKAALHKGGIEELRTAYVKAWWAGQLINDNRNVSEKMVLFWHNHFAIEFAKVFDSRYCYTYLDLIRKHALGNFKQLAREMTVNPAMLVYLNGNSNNKDAPNENYGRELQELFMVGKGPDSHYTEGDVKAAAKVLTGWKDDKEHITSFFDGALHNTTDKIFSPFYDNHVIKGRSGAEGAKETDELIEMICRQHEVSKFLCRKLYRYFVDCNIDERVEAEVITPIAELLVRSDYEVKPVIKAMLTADFFYAPELLGCMIKSPVDYFIGFFKEFDVQFEVENKKTLYRQWWVIATWLGYMGQDIGDPPGVAGWPAYYEVPFFYRDWVNSETLSTREKMARLLSYPKETDGLLKFDFIRFVHSLPVPESAAGVIAQTVDLCCGIRPGPVQMNYLVTMLDTEQNHQQAWAGLWEAHKNNPGSEDVLQNITRRLAKVFSIIFTMPEFHLM